MRNSSKGHARKANNSPPKSGRKSSSQKSREKSYITPENQSPNSYIIGFIDMKQTGKAYLLPVDKLREDVFIAANHTLHALHGDKVKVFLFPRRFGRKAEGQVTEILERNKKEVVGVVEIGSKFSFVLPDSLNIPVDIFIPMEDLNGAKDGDKVLVHITDWPKHMNNPIGQIVHVLGRPGENNVEMQSILAEYSFPLTYPQQAIDEAMSIESQISKEEIAKRRDCREVWTCTIDPEDAKDFDDALSYRVLKDGSIEVGVHIADVSHYVKEGSEIDKEAFDRATSVYLVDRTIPMLPERLCNDLCSLNPNEDKLAFSVVFLFSKGKAEGEVIMKDVWIGKTVIHSNQRYTYAQAQDIIEGNADQETNENSKAVLGLHELAQIFRAKRFKDGAINFHSQEVRFVLDEQAKPLGVFVKESKESNFLVEEFMLLANKKVAESVGKQKTPKTFVYRVHDEPNPEKLAVFSEFVGKLGYKMNISSKGRLAKSFNQLLDRIQGKGEQNMIETIAIRTMSRAYYSTQNIGHYGLSFAHYSHFTSPIRRYPDLMVHRLLMAYHDNKGSANEAAFEEYCKHCSDMEKKASDAERASVKYKQAEFLTDKVGQDFYGLISGVSKWGIYVCLEENYCEGMVSLRSLSDDYYELDEDNYRVIGKRRGMVYALGDRVKVKVNHVDMNKKQMDFLFV